MYFLLKGTLKSMVSEAWQVGKVVMEARLMLVSGLPFQAFDQKKQQGKSAKK